MGVLRRVWMWSAVAGLLGAATVGRAFAADDVVQFTGNELRISCNEKNAEEQNPNWFICIYSVNGISQGYQTGIQVGYLYGTGHEMNGKDYKKLLSYCVPKNVTREQGALVVSKFLADHPERLNESYILLVRDALKFAWPCPAQ